jgi:NhaP-type Na+/H+ or K+/H+ antiporter
VVAIAVVAVTTITSSSLGTVAAGERATVATAAFTVLGTIVGAYFGVKVGARGKDEAESARALAAAKVERLAAHVDSQKADEVMDAVNRAAGPEMPAR